jgi:hypothetical protein
MQSTAKGIKKWTSVKMALVFLAKVIGILLPISYIDDDGLSAAAPKTPIHYTVLTFNFLLLMPVWTMSIASVALSSVRS